MAPKSMLETARVSSCLRHKIIETVYESAIDYRKLMVITLAYFDDNNANAITANAIAPWPNTYNLTKASTEDFIRQFSCHPLPFAIIRLTIDESRFIRAWNSSELCQ